MGKKSKRRGGKPRRRQREEAFTSTSDTDVVQARRPTTPRLYATTSLTSSGAVVQAPSPTCQFDDKALADAKEALLQALIAAASANDYPSDQALDRYTDILMHRAFASRYDESLLATKQDRKLLKKMSTGSGSRRALMVRAQIFFSSLEFYDYALYFEKLVDLCDESLSSPEIMENAERVDFFTPFRRFTMGQLSAIRETKLDEATIATNGSIMPAFLLEGERCDSCGKSRWELGVKELLVCAKCKTTHYCSRECEKADWKRGGHKHFCRSSEREFKVGDHVLSWGPPGVDCVVPTCLFQIKAPASHDPDPENPTHWVVGRPGRDDATFIMHNHLMKRARPSLWREYGLRQLETDHS